MLFPILQAAIFYLIMINLSAINNISLVISGNDNCSPAVAISKACKLRKREPGILVTAALSNLGFTGVEALFRYRVITDHRSPGMPSSCGMIWEIFLISYMYSVVIILDMVACCLFLKRRSTEDHEEDEGDDAGYHVV
ncbi:hypothetical protein MLD38_033897 [Melastoma candidum]|nr:hypothetical protein MLD38_033897 [Melastoma candidum]